MLQRRFRLRDSAAFERARAQGRQWRHPWLTMTVVANGLAHNRYGFIGTRRLGSAVVRNRTRRVLREIVRRAAPELRPGYDLVFVIRNAAVNQPYNEVMQVVDSLFRRAGLWQGGRTEGSENETRGDGADPVV